MMKRRTFLKSASALVAPMTVPMAIPASALGLDDTKAPSGRIHLGGIGINDRGGYVLGYFLDQPDVRFRAIADVRRDRREIVKNLADQRYGSNDTAMYRDFHELLERSDIDAVLIATGDRWHTPVSIAAAKTGKHIYCEKPCGLTIGHCQRLAEAVNRAGVVFQGGTQRRNVVNCRFACELARNGFLGKIHTVHASIYYLQMRTDWLAAEPVPDRDEIDWDLWLGPAPWRPYHHAYIYEGRWRSHYDFDSGARHLDWGAHTVDLCQMALEKDGTAPVAYWSEGNRLFAEYADGVKLVMRPDGWRGLGTCPVRFEGDEGWVEIGDSGRIALSDPRLRPRIDHRLKKDLSNRLSFGECPAGHVRDFLDCMKSGDMPAANVNVIRSSHIACHASALSWILRRELRFDPVKEEFIGDDEANRLRFRVDREPYSEALPSEELSPETVETLEASANRLLDLTCCGTADDRAEIERLNGEKRLATCAATALMNLPGPERDRFFAQKRTEAAAYHDAPQRFTLRSGFSELEEPTLEALMALLPKLEAEEKSGESKKTPKTAYDAALLLCRRSPEPDRWADAIFERVQSDPRAQKPLACDLLLALESGGALTALTALAKSNDAQAADRATERLGEWPNFDAAPVLLELARTLASEKLRVRCCRGVLRLIRQMTDDFSTQQTFLAEALDAAPRQEEWQLAESTLAEIEGRSRFQPLFDGKTFDGWEGEIGKTFRIEDEAIVAGSLDEPIRRNEFLTTKEEFLDFDITLEAKIEGDGGNAGIQFRSQWIENHHEMIGYQADMTTDGEYWGHLYDESRRNRFLVEPDPIQISRLYRPGEWNRYRILCWGDRVILELNGERTADYFETDFPPEAGRIGVQIHAGPPSRALYRHIRIERFGPKRFYTAEY